MSGIWGQGMLFRVWQDMDPRMLRLALSLDYRRSIDGLHKMPTDVVNSHRLVNLARKCR